MSRSIANELLYISLLKAQQEFTSGIRACLADKNLTVPQFNLLRILVVHDNAGCKIGHIKERMVARVPDLTRLIDRMIRDGLVERVDCPSDRRAYLIFATSLGLKHYKAADKAVLSKLEQLAGNLTEKEQLAATNLLQKLLEK